MGIFSNYCGLGGSGIPQHEIDKICKWHDEEYTEITKKKGWKAAYLEYNEADAKFFERVSAVVPQSNKEAIVQEVSRAYFALKRLAAKHTAKQLKDDNNSPSNLRKRPIEVEITPDSNVKTAGDISNERSNKRVKRLRSSGNDDNDNVRRPLVWGKSFFNLP